VISLPLNVFYGAGVPACLLILKKQRPPERHDKVLLVYAARHFRELSNQNELRPQDVMRMLVHVQAYGDATKVAGLVAQHSQRIREQINAREHDQIERLEAEYADHATRLSKLKTQVAEARAEFAKITARVAKNKAEAALAKLEGQHDKAAAKVAERDEKDRRSPTPRR
jgi:type I restriction enzyme M protein